MDELDEGKVRRLRDQILSRGLRPLRVNVSLVRGFMALKLGPIDLSAVRAAVTPAFDPQTAEVLTCLQRPFGEFFDFADARALGGLLRLCKAEGVAVPRAEDRSSIRSSP